MTKKTKLIRIATIPGSFNLLRGQLRFLNETYETIALASDSEKLYEAGDREGVRVIGVDMERRFAPLKDLRSLWEMYKVLRKEKPTMVHSITPKAGLIGMLAAKLAGVPIRMHTFTGLVFPTSTGLTRRILMTTDRLTCWAATQVYPEGNGVKRDLEIHGITKKPLKVIGNGNVNGVNTELYNPHVIDEGTKQTLRSELGIAPGDFIFVFVGRLVRDKGVNELVQAFEKVSGIHPNAKLLLLGMYEEALDPLLPEVLACIQSNPCIHAVGYKTNVRDYLAISDVLVLPSYREGFPNVVLQAVAMNLNCIATNINGCNEIITDKANGFLVEPKNSEQLIDRMNWCVANAEESAKMGANGHAFIQSHFANEFVWKATQAEYQRLEAQLSKK